MENIKCEFISGLGDISAENWLAGSNNPTTSYDFLKALEDTGCVNHDSGWQSCHLILSQDGKVIANVPLYLKQHPYGEYIFDHNLQETYYRLQLNYYPKLLSAIPFTPVTGERILTNQNKQNLLPTLLQNIKEFAIEKNCSSFHFNFIPEADTASLQQNNMVIRKTHQYHWYNRNYKDFDEFLETLSSRKRKNIKKERGHIERLGIRHKRLSGGDLTPQAMDVFYKFYCMTYDKKWGSPYLSREFFHRIAEVMPEQVLLIIGEHVGEPISGALNFIGKDCLIGRNWGSNRAIDFLHFETCYYQALDFACAHGLKWVEAGTQGEHKLQRGYEPVLTYSAHYLMHEALHEAYGDFLRKESDSMEDLMEHLRRYTPFRREVSA